MHRCLVVEPSTIVRRIFKAILPDFGFEVVEAETGRDAISMLQRHIPRLAIVDAALVDMVPLGVVHEMRSLVGARTRILYCTTLLEVAELHRACAAGATDVLIKPFDRHSIAAKLDALNNGEQESPRENFFNRLSRSELRIA